MTEPADALAELGEVETLMMALRHASPHLTEEQLRYEAEGMLEGERERAEERRARKDAGR